jgi:Uma2 family endonuclease
MALSNPLFSSDPRAGRRYLRAPAPLHFPVEERVPETTRHFRLRTALYQSIELAFRGTALVGSDQFLYFDAADPKRCLAPDVMFRRGSSRLLPSWKTWEHGAPEVGVEIVSESDAGEREVAEKLERYRQAGVREVVVFDPNRTDAALRCFDLFDGDLVERDPSDPEARRCDALGAYWCIVMDAELGPTLRLSRERDGSVRLPTPEEAERAQKEAERAQKEAERAQKEAERAQKEVERAQKEAALRRVEELEAELAKRR